MLWKLHLYSVFPLNKISSDKTSQDLWELKQGFYFYVKAEK